MQFCRQDIHMLYYNTENRKPATKHTNKRKKQVVFAKNKGTKIIDISFDIFYLNLGIGITMIHNLLLSIYIKHLFIIIKFIITKLYF